MSSDEKFLCNDCVGWKELGDQSITCKSIVMLLHDIISNCRAQSPYTAEHIIRHVIMANTDGRDEGDRCRFHPSMVQIRHALILSDSNSTLKDDERRKALLQNAVVLNLNFMNGALENKTEILSPIQVHRIINSTIDSNFAVPEKAEEIIRKYNRRVSSQTVESFIEQDEQYTTLPEELRRAKLENPHLTPIQLRNLYLTGTLKVDTDEDDSDRLSEVSLLVEAARYEAGEDRDKLTDSILSRLES